LEFSIFAALFREIEGLVQRLIVLQSEKRIDYHTTPCHICMYSINLVFLEVPYTSLVGLSLLPISGWIQHRRHFINATTQNYLPNRSEDVFITFLGINLRDQIRKYQNVPVQFLYDAADYRIFYTAITWSDYAQLWTYAANAIFSNPKLCGPGSTGYASSSTGATVPPQYANSVKYNASTLIGTTKQFTNEFTGLQLDSFKPTIKGTARTVSQACNNHGLGCSFGRCHLDFKAPAKQGTFGGKSLAFRSGTCSVTAPSGGLSNLETKQDQPAEIHGGANRGKDAVADAINEGVGREA